MSLSSFRILELKAFKKKKLKYRLGDLVVTKKEKRNKLMVVTNLLPTGAREGDNADYFCDWISSQGKSCFAPFEEKEIKKYKL